MTEPVHYLDCVVCGESAHLPVSIEISAEREWCENCQDVTIHERAREAINAK